MAYFGKTFNQVKHENFEEFVAALNVPEAYSQKIFSYKPALKLEKNGDSYTIHVINTGEKGSKSLTFTSGVSFDEEIYENLTAKSKVTVDGDVVTHEQTFPTGRTFVIKREFSADAVKVTLTITGWDGAATLYYSAA